MKVLIIHNQYQSSGGEDLVFSQEVNSIQGFAEVKSLVFKNKKKLQGIRQFLLFPWNYSAWKNIKAEISTWNPDIIHFHNIHYAIGPWSIREIAKLKIPMVMTVHNYRLLCPSATLYYKGMLYTKSIEQQFPWDAVWKGVQDSSIIKTFWFAFTNYFHRKIGTWQKINKYLVLTDFAKDLMIHSSFPVKPSQIIVKPNFLRENLDDKLEIYHEKSNFYLFVGRLSEEKGVKTLIKAFTSNGLNLKIAGTGPLENWIQENTKHVNNIEILGAQPSDKVHELMQQCQALIFPSEWYEGMPMTILEALKNGTIIIASNLGAMSSMIFDQKNGILFEAKSSQKLNHALNQLSNKSKNEIEQIRKAARLTFLNLYDEKSNMEQLEAIYNKLLTAKSR